MENLNILWKIINMENKCKYCHLDDGNHKMSCSTKKLVIDDEDIDDRIILEDNLTYKEKYIILQNVLISLHTASWTGNDKNFKSIMNKIASFSYARTNSTMDDIGDNNNMISTLKDLQDLYK